MNISPYVFPGIPKLKSFQSDSVLSTRIIDSVCEHFKISFESICTRDRHRKYVYPRSIIMRMLRKYTKMGLKEIGSMFSPRLFDHTSIMHNIKVLQGFMDTDPIVKQEVDHIEIQVRKFTFFIEK